jgi:hypothetical protein
MLCKNNRSVRNDKKLIHVHIDRNHTQYVIEHE